MNAGPNEQILAVLDTSFWVAGYRAEIVANCLDLLTSSCRARSKLEIRAVQATAPRREYPYATLFRQLRRRMLEPPPDAPQPLPVFGAGEAEAVALAGHLHAVLLINERRAARYAARTCGSTSSPCPRSLWRSGLKNVIGDRAARRNLALIRSITSPDIVNEALLVLDVDVRPKISLVCRGAPAPAPRLTTILGQSSLPNHEAALPTDACGPALATSGGHQ